MAWIWTLALLFINCVTLGKVTQPFWAFASSVLKGEEHLLLRVVVRIQSMEKTAWCTGSVQNKCKNQFETEVQEPGQGTKGFPFIKKAESGMT